MFKEKSFLKTFGQANVTFTDNYLNSRSLSSKAFTQPRVKNLTSKVCLKTN